MSSETDNTFSISTIFVVVGIDLNTVLNLSCPQFCNNYIMDGDWRPCPWFSLSIRAGFLFQKQRVFSLFREVLLLWDVLKINTHCSMKNILFSQHKKIFYRIKKIFNVYLKIYI